MIEKIILGTLFDESFQRKLDSLPRNCLRSGREKVKCTKCIDICPEKAIKATPDGILVDTLLCGGCNLCVTSCYSRIYTGAKKPYLNSLNRIVDGDISIWKCKKTAGKEDVNFGCLRTIDPRYLMALAYADLDHKVFLDYSQCEGCEYEKLGLDTWALIQEIQEKGDLKNIVFALEEGIRKEDEEVNLSRRDFLNSILRDSKEMTKSALKETTKSLGLDLEEKENIDGLIKILLKKGLPQGRDPSWMREYIFDIRVDESCKFCYECVNSCPTKALEIVNDKDKLTLKIDPGLCNYCGRCMEKCRYKAVSKVDFTDFKEKLLYNRKKDKCKGCLTLTTSLNEEGYCMTCAIRNRNRKKIK